MSNLSVFEKTKFEKIFGMESGYVLDFSNRTFQEFIVNTVNVDIYDDKYNYSSGSKANRLRSFWDQESNYMTGILLCNLLEYWKTLKLTSYTEIDPSEQALFHECEEIAKRLRQDVDIKDVDAIRPYSEDKDFALLAKSIRESINQTEPEVALDRLHTFLIKYVRQLCDKHGISYDKGKPLQSLFGEYVKLLVRDGIIESNMTERILKSSISILDAFNDVRNNQSFAHDNPILNYGESVLIFNSVSSVIRFIESIENGDTEEEIQESDANWEDIPF